ncbi:hypothetical protein TRFO_14177 [Tritrichomonas foetus]|uniref:Uncharacterized protein n=1 Tax=Tritrichomonas foetus TaxID=1144522 RepID=A0A1J4KWZ9_9EUKA|nr:hypothetical protein TRFO_14177 [Tritrichomonas foetus]|eukprot:OHT15408.1 hypothetical protein TRFO_14177 [Tritrichomonas foetus]
MSKQSSNQSNKNQPDEQQTGEQSQSWSDFMASVTEELDSMNQQLENVCFRGRRNNRSKSPRTPRTPRGAVSPRTVNTKLIAELEKRRAESPTGRQRPEKDVDRELMTNYKFFPTRKNASARIFKPDKLKYDTYRNPKRVVPVLTGSPMRTSFGQEEE